LVLRSFFYGFANSLSHTVIQRNTNAESGENACQSAVDVRYFAAHGIEWTVGPGNLESGLEVKIRSNFALFGWRSIRVSLQSFQTFVNDLDRLSGESLAKVRSGQAAPKLRQLGQHNNAVLNLLCNGLGGGTLALVQLEVRTSKTSSSISVNISNLYTISYRFNTSKHFPDVVERFCEECLKHFDSDQNANDFVEYSDHYVEFRVQYELGVGQVNIRLSFGGSSDSPQVVLVAVEGIQGESYYGEVERDEVKLWLSRLRLASRSITTGFTGSKVSSQMG
jgi:hypothetical protein